MNKKIVGMSLIDILIGLTLALVLSTAVLRIYVAQMNTYKTHNAQTIMADAHNAISALVLPVIRGAGFAGCASVFQAASNLTPGGPAPLGTLNATISTVKGYDAAAGTVLTIAAANAANSAANSDWSPVLDATLVGNVIANSDVLIILGAPPHATSMNVTANTSGNTITLQNTSNLTAGQFGAISDCMTASILAITGVNANSITAAQGNSALENANNTLNIHYGAGAQFMQITQTAFFVAHHTSDQSSLVKATLNANGTWNIQALIPGIETMQVLYGIGSGGTVTQYIPASSVADWGSVYAVRLGFLIAGEQSSAAAAPTQYTLLGNTITVPADNRLRHVFEMTVQLRNAL